MSETRNLVAIRARSKAAQARKAKPARFVQSGGPVVEIGEARVHYPLSGPKNGSM
jgi:hypothetical protein